MKKQMSEIEKDSMAMGLVKNDSLNKRYDPRTKGSDSGHQNTSYAIVAENQKGKIIYENIIHSRFDADRVDSNAYISPIVDCISVNVAGFGYRIKPRNKKVRDVDLSEEARIENFMRYINPDEDLSLLIQSLVVDYTTNGFCCAEIVRTPFDLGNKDFNDPLNQPKIEGVFHIKAHQIEKSRVQQYVYMYPRKVIVRNESGKGYQVKTKLDSKRFRLYRQSYDDGKTFIFFKEFGDPRFYHRETGELLEKKSDIRKAVRNGKVATELWYMEDKVVKGMYSSPKHRGLSVDLIGDEQASEINANVVRKNAVPNIAITGDIDDSSIRRLSEFNESVENNRYRRNMILWLKPLTDDFGKESKLNIIPLKDSQINDSMFKDYRNKVKNDVREAHRLPEIVLSQKSGSTREEIKSNIALAEEQVFAPIRAKFERFINDYVLPDLDIASTVIYLNTPNVTEATALINLIRDFEKTGSITPKIARFFLEQITGESFDEISEDIKPDIPYSYTMAEIVKNQANAEEPTQQVTSQPQNNKLEDNERDAANDRK